MKKPKTPGPKPDNLQLYEGDWRIALGKAIKKKKPEEGWPKPEKSKTDEN